MLIENESLYEALGAKLRAYYPEGTYVFVNAIYEPDDDGGPHEAMYHAAVDLREPGETYHVWFILTIDDRIAHIDEIERWIMG